MALTLNKLDRQLQTMGQTLAAKQQRKQELLAEVGELLVAYASRYEELRELARRSAQSLKWLVAIPENEPLNSAHSAPPPPLQATLIAADGSSVEPDRHGAALYYLINIGSIVLEHGKGKRPFVQSEPMLYFEDKDLYEDGRLVQGNLLDLRMATAEMETLATLAAQAKTPPILALIDGTLLLWFPKDTPELEQRARMAAYLGAMSRLHDARAALAGFTSRPRHSEVVNLLYLASLGREASRRDLDEHRFAELEDRELFAFLRPGERSALFASSSPVNNEYGRRHRAYEVLFFYLNVGDERYTEIARVEVPRWVASENAPQLDSTARPVESAAGYSLLDFAQATICQQCRIARHYPYVLARAHELAVISVEERRDLELRVIAAMARHGILASPSEKAQLKELTGSKVRRYSS